MVGDDGIEPPTLCL
ncbi:hypothetical protein SAMN04490179_2922 [Pseudomonas antarctica]|uniref:Uncharacterized protein n=1 Tax=Pseudomonas antarctica TaxID=219572 RepID=A0A1G9Z706_9PSED|nr:hypothetical protein SAMN04490179_2922 [Pseudomonas antarctica]